MGMAAIALTGGDVFGHRIGMSDAETITVQGSVRQLIGLWQRKIDCGGHCRFLRFL